MTSQHQLTVWVWGSKVICGTDSKGAGPKDLVHIYHTADLLAVHARWKSAVLFLSQGVIVLGSLTLGFCIFCQFLIPSGFDHDPQSLG